MNKEQIRWFNGGLTKKERLELCSLEYVLTFMYTNNLDDDEKRHKELSSKKWAYRELYPIDNRI